MMTPASAITDVWYEQDERYLPAHHQPGLLLDLLLARDISSHKVLRGTGLFYDDILGGHSRISPQQLRQLIANGEKLSATADLSFRWGQLLWPGHYGLASQLLQHAGNLQQALEVLTRHRRYLSPLLVPRVFCDRQYCYVQWLDACGLGEQKRFMVETAMTALSSYSRWQSRQPLPWEYGFSYAQPRADEQYRTHLGSTLYFDLGVDVMRIPKTWLQEPWPQASATAFRVAARHLNTEPAIAESGFSEAVYQHLLQHIQQPLSLAETAEHFGMSSATFKRKLQRHDTHFQHVQDQVRLHASLYCLHILGWSNEQLAQYLQFNDLTNFRRAFRRWCGRTPAESRQLLLPA